MRKERERAGVQLLSPACISDSLSGNKVVAGWIYEMDHKDTPDD